MMKKEHVIINGELARTESLDGKEMLVVPAVILKEGVLNNLFYSEEEIAKIPQAWNGRPVPVYHPENDGEATSASSPELAESIVGTVYNTVFEDGKLKTELWIDKDKIAQVDPEALKRLEANEVMDVSTGLFLEVDETPGEWNGQTYIGVATNFVPDHLALLPNEVGACSVSDGCGTPRVNKEKPMGEEQGRFEKIINAIRSVVSPPKLEENELSHDDIRVRLRQALEEEATGDYFYVVDVFDKFFIYEQMNDSFQGGRLFKRSYAANDRDEVLLVDDTVEVTLEMSYTPINTPKPGESIIKSGPGSMETVINEESEKMEKIEKLIANEASPYTAEDTEWLEGLSECQFNKLVAPFEVTENEEEVVENKEEVDFVKATDLPSLIAEGVKAAMAVNSTMEIVERLSANEGCPISKEALLKMNESDLVALETTILPEHSFDFSGRALPQTNSGTKIEPLSVEPVVTAEVN